MPKCPESYANVKFMFEQLKLEAVKFVRAADLKMSKSIYFFESTVYRIFTF